MSSGGADDGLQVCGRLDLMYADTTVKSTLLPAFTWSPVSTSVSSAPIRASTLSRKGGMREDLRFREWLLWWGLEEGPGEDEVERELPEPRLGREKREPEQWPLHWVLQLSWWWQWGHCSGSSGSSQASGRQPWEVWWWWTLGWDEPRWWYRRFLWGAPVRLKVEGAEADSATVDEMWQWSCLCLKWALCTWVGNKRKTKRIWTKCIFELD